MPTIPYVKQGAPFIDHASDAAATFAAADANAIDTGVYEAHLQPCVRAYHNAAQSVTSGTPLALALNSERFDQAAGVADTMHDTATNNSRLTCRYAGVYQITAQVEWAANATPYRNVSIRLNGATTIVSNVLTAIGSGAVTVQFVTTLYPLAVNDYVEAVVDQTSGGGLNVNSTANRSPEFMMVRVG